MLSLETLDKHETLMKTGENTIARYSFMLIIIKEVMIYSAVDTLKKKGWLGFDHNNLSQYLQDWFHFKQNLVTCSMLTQNRGP